VRQAYDVRFGPDVARDVTAGRFFLTETIRAPHSGVDPDPPAEPRHARHDGERLVLSLGPDGTASDTYSTVEVSSTRRFDQSVLQRLLLDGSPRVMVPGRRAVYRDIVWSPEFGDGRAGRETVTTGVTVQSWRGIEDGGIDFAHRPEFFIASIAFIGGPGLLPKLFSRTLGSRQPFVASVVDFKVGLAWFQPLRDVFDPTEPHDLSIRWHRAHDVSFAVDDTEVARYEDGKLRPYPLKLRNRQLWRGTDLLGHRYVGTDPCHIDVWINSSAMGTTPTVPNGRRFRRDLSVALEGFAIEPFDG